MRAKTFGFLSVVPVVLASGFVSVRAAMSLLVAISLVAVLLSYRGLLSDQAYKFFPLSSPLYSSLWVFERSLSVYWALYWRARYGGYPFGQRVLSKGTGEAWVAGGRIQSRDLARGQQIESF
jgi:hypothetical protein